MNIFAKGNVTIRKIEKDSYKHLRGQKQGIAR